MTQPTVYKTIIAPLLPLLQKEVKLLKADHYTLSLYFFTMNLCYAIITRIRSIRLLRTEIKTSEAAKKLGLMDVSSSMYSEAFLRYDPMIFKRLFMGLLQTIEFKSIPEINSLGRFILMDGSIFPAIKTMDWACYKKTANGIKLHLSFELNRMIPVQFISTEANGSEKKILQQVLEVGVTYIADRGYIAFDLFMQIVEQSAFFIIRVKANMKYIIEETHDVCLPENWDSHLSNAHDYRVTFTGDKQKKTYRLITFEALGEIYQIATNRFDLKTHEIIMLYAYRWQIELFFRCLKRCFKGLHLWSHEAKGIQIQFYLYLIVYLLLLHFKQQCHEKEQESTPSISSSKNQRQGATRTPACGIVTLLGNQLKGVWKIGIHWLKAIKNVLTQPFTEDINKLLNSV